jgi:hypothetical protein
LERQVKSGRLNRTLERRGDPQMFFRVVVQAGAGTQELATPRAKDGIPQPFTALLTVSAVRHKYSNSV